MEEVFKIAGIGIITSIAVMVLKETKPTIAVVTAIAGGLLAVLVVVDYLTGVLSSVLVIVDKTGLDRGLIGIILRIIGVGYIIEFAAGVCDESGTKQTGDKIILAGKIIIMTMALPIVVSLIELVTELIL